MVLTQQQHFLLAIQSHRLSTKFVYCLFDIFYNFIIVLLNIFERMRKHFSWSWKLFCQWICCLRAGPLRWVFAGATRRPHSVSAKPNGMGLVARYKLIGRGVFKTTKSCFESSQKCFRGRKWNCRKSQINSTEISLMIYGIVSQTGNAIVATNGFMFGGSFIQTYIYDLDLIKRTKV